MYRYISLLKDEGRDFLDHSIHEALRTAGLVREMESNGYDLYVSTGTPVLHISPTTTVVGHIFQRNENLAIDDPGPLARIPPHLLPDYLIQEYWGEYVLLQRETEHQLTVMRDPSGGAGCVYSSDGRFVTSDISLATGSGLYTKQIDWDFIRDDLVYPHLKTGRTGSARINELLPGRMLQLSCRGGITREVWTPWDFVSANTRYQDLRDARAAVRETVESTVKAWAETDGSILLELSGGLDSSVVAACLMGTRADVTCCNLMTPVPGADERLYAEQVSALLGSELLVQKLGIEGAELSFPPPPHAVSPSTWFLQHASNEAKQSIGQQIDAGSYYSGGGGDTVFGYTKSAVPAVDALKERGIACCLKTIRNLAELHQCTVWKVARLAARKLAGPPKPPRRPDHTFLSFKSGLEASTLHPWFTAPPAALPGDMERIFDLAGNQAFRDGVARSGQRQLRMPLLSQPVMETCLSVPSWMWFANGRDRVVAREAFADRLPADVFHRRSKGTFMNYTGAVYRRNIHRLKEYLSNGELAAHGLLDTGSLRSFLDSSPDSHGDSFMRIFDLCEIENWVRHQT